MVVAKNVYPYEYMDDWEKVSETLPDQEDFYSHLNIEDITDAGYTHTKRVCKGFHIKEFRWTPWFVSSNWYIIAGRFVETTCGICLEIYGLDPAHILSAPCLAWQAAMWLMWNMWKPITNTWKIMIEIKNHHILSIGT